jgi:hypothetical protein
MAKLAPKGKEGAAKATGSTAAPKTAKATAAAAKAAAKKTPAKGGAKKIRRGSRYSCEVCGVVVSVDEVCGCAEAHDIICCGQAMKTTR